jgi:pimeloyl-ACP methyl ester carboxylesterase
VNTRRVLSIAAVSAIGLAAAGVGAAVATGGTLVRIDRSRASETGRDELELPGDVVHHELETSDGGTLHYVDRGEGRPIVLLHGVTLSHRIWPYQLRDLVESGHRVIALDQRGHGSSVPGEHGMRIEAMASDAAELVEALDLRGAVVVGHSMGSMVTIELALRHPELFDERIGAVALIGASACVPLAARRLAQTVNATGLGARVLEGREAGLLPGGDPGYVFARIAFGVRPDPHQVALTWELSSAMAPLKFNELLPSLVAFDHRRHLARIGVPALVTVGPVDRILPPSCHRYLASHLPAARRLELAGCGHMVMLERHRQLNAALVELSSGLS